MTGQVASTTASARRRGAARKKTRLSPNWRKVFAVALAETSNVSRSCETAGVSVSTVYARAVVGGELIQFARAEPLGAGVWHLSDLLRGRGGTEPEIFGHVADEVFVLFDENLVALDPALVGDAALAQIAALGLVDPAPVLSPILLAGATRRPLSPVHGKLTVATDGALTLGWTRRARGALRWPDAVDTPLNEAAEAYRIVLGDPASPVAQWVTAEARLEISATLATQLRVEVPGAWFAVRQRGDHGLSEPLALGPLV